MPSFLQKFSLNLAPFQFDAEDPQLESISKEDLGAFVPFLSLTTERTETEVVVGEEKLEIGGSDASQKHHGKHVAGSTIKHPILSVVHHRSSDGPHQQSNAQVVVNSETLNLYPRIIILIVEKLLHIVHSPDIMSKQKHNVFDEQRQTEILLAEEIHAILQSHQAKENSVKFY